MSPPLLDEAVLLHDFLAEVPRQDEQVIGTRFTDALRRHDRQMGAGQVAALLVRPAVQDVTDEIPAHAAIVEQRIAFRRGAVGGDAFAGPLGADEKVEQVALGLAYPLLEGRVALEAVKARGTLIAQYFCDVAGGGAGRPAGGAQKNPQRAAA